MGWTANSSSRCHTSVKRTCEHNEIFSISTGFVCIQSCDKATNLREFINFYSAQHTPQYKNMFTITYVSLTNNNNSITQAKEHFFKEAGAYKPKLYNTKWFKSFPTVVHHHSNTCFFSTINNSPLTINFTMYCWWTVTVITDLSACKDAGR